MGRKEEKYVILQSHYTEIHELKVQFVRKLIFEFHSNLSFACRPT